MRLCAKHEIDIVIVANGCTRYDPCSIVTRAVHVKVPVYSRECCCALDNVHTVDLHEMYLSLMASVAICTLAGAVTWWTSRKRSKIWIAMEELQLQCRKGLNNIQGS